MWFFSKRQSRRPKLIRRAPSTFRPRLEALEDRCLLSTAGYLDTSFNSPNGYVSNLPGNFGDAAVYPASAPNGDAGKIVVAGNAPGKAGEQSVAVTRYNSNGTVDTTFGNGGTVTTTLGSYSSGASGIVIDNQGRILVCGTEQVSRLPVKPFNTYNNEWVVARYNSDGTLDKTFGKNGVVQTNIGPGDDEAFTLGIEPWDGKIVVAGYSDQSGTGTTSTVARYNTNGTLDSTFGTNGIFLLNNIHGPDSLSGLAFNQTTGPSGQSVDQIVLVGNEGVSSQNGGTNGFLIVRLNGNNGTLDSSFNGQGYEVSVPPTTQGGDASSVVIQANGSIDVDGLAYYGSAGTAGNPADQELAVAQFTPTGAADTTFGNTLGSNYALLSQFNYGRGMAIAPNTGGELDIAGGILLPNSTTGEAAVARLETNGSALDPNFGTSGVSQPVPITGTGFHGLALDSYGNIVAVGNNLLARFYGTTGPQIGSFTASPNPVTSGSSLTLTASNITDGNPNSTITQVTFYYFDSNGNKVVLGYGTEDSSGNWNLTFNVSLTAGTYTIYAQAKDNYGVLGDPDSLSLTVN